MVAELRRVCWLRHGGREGGHGARGEAVTIVRTAEHVEAAHTRMVHLKVGKKNDLLIARDGSCVAEIRRVREVNKLHESEGWWGQIESAWSWTISCRGYHIQINKLLGGMMWCHKLVVVG